MSVIDAVISTWDRWQVDEKQAALLAGYLIERGVIPHKTGPRSQKMFAAELGLLPRREDSYDNLQRG